jgi:sulfatase maturation enzyme AslB (radical SAM superfamily)
MKPGFCCFGITDRCMLKCKMCQKWKEDIYITNASDTPTLEQWKECVVDLSKMVSFPFELDIGGGEALMFPQVLDLVRFSVDRGFNTSIASNGWLIDEELAKKIAASGLKAISLSLDSPKKEVHDFLRGRVGVYDHVMAAIGYLHKHCKGIYINLCCVFYQFNQDNIPELVEWANNNPMIGSINFMAAMQPNNTSPLDDWWHSELGSIWPQDPQKTVGIIQQVIDMKKKGYKVGNPVSQLMAFQSYYQHPQSSLSVNSVTLTAVFWFLRSVIYTCAMTTKRSATSRLTGCWMSGSRKRPTRSGRISQGARRTAII